jgi:hypothetical protein
MWYAQSRVTTLKQLLSRVTSVAVARQMARREGEVGGRRPNLTIKANERGATIDKPENKQLQRGSLRILVLPLWSLYSSHQPILLTERIYIAFSHVGGFSGSVAE